MGDHEDGQHGQHDGHTDGGHHDGHEGGHRDGRPPTPIDEASLQAYYARDGERDRLAFGVGRLEFERTVEVVSRVVPPAPATVADIGGGPGRYTAWLLSRGHRVVHRDLVAAHVDQVRAMAGRSYPDPAADAVLDGAVGPAAGPAADGAVGPAVDAAVGDARQLDLADRSVDAVLLLGPLYHLPDRSDRVQALREAARAVRPGSPVVAAAISRWAPRLDGLLLKRYHLDHPGMFDLVDEVERSGRLEPALDGGFNGFTHRPDELAAEVAEAGLVLDGMVSVEGVAFAFGDADVEARLTDPDDRELLLDAIRATEAVPELLGVGPHLLATAHRPPRPGNSPKFGA